LLVVDGCCAHDFLGKERRLELAAKSDLYGMRRQLFSWTLRCLILLGLSIVSMAMSHAEVPSSSDSSYTFLAAGHWYGAHGNARAIAPASSLYAGLDRIKALHPKLIFALGDLVRDGDDQRQWVALNQLIASMGSQTWNVLGNHDLSQDAAKNTRFFTLNGGTNTLLQLEYHGDQFLLLETEALRFGGAKGLLEQLHQAEAANPGRNLFVFSHRLLWALAEPGFEEMDDFANAPFAPEVNRDSLKMVYDAVLKLAGEAQLYWFSGDIGAEWSDHLFEGSSADSKRHFYAAGLGDSDEDAFWQVNIAADGAVRVLALPLFQPTTQVVGKAYGLEEWRLAAKMRATEEQHTQQTTGDSLLKSKKLWLGLGLGLCLGFALAWLLKRRK
jgi:hypothetical protein